MKTLSPLLALALTSFLLFPSLVPAQDTSSNALSYDRYPTRFDSRNPLHRDSPILLRFNAAVDPSEAERFFRLYDQTNERTAAISASRPSDEVISAFRNGHRGDEAIDRFLLVRPANHLPLGGTWYLNGIKGFKAISGEHEIVESRLDYVGSLYAFSIDEVETRSDYDDPLSIWIRHNKMKLNPEFDAEAVAEYISIDPVPNNFRLDLSNYRIDLEGDFQYGVSYRIRVRDGLIGHDETRLDQVVEETVVFEPNPGFVTLPAFQTTQNAAGHRKFDVNTGNLTGLRTRVKKLEGDNLVLAMREYDDKYEGWGEQQTLEFSTVPGTTIYDEFRESTAAIDRTDLVSLDWNELTGAASTGAFYLCAEGRSATRDHLEVGAQSLIQLTDIGLAWKQAPEGSTIYAFSLATGSPLPEVTIRLLDDSAKEIASHETNGDGIAFLPGGAYQDKEGRHYLDASIGDDRHVISFYEELNSVGLWSFAVDQRWDELLDDERRTLLFTDRNVYRPGDEVKLKAISRFIDADQLLGPGKGEAVLKVYDSRHRQIIEREVSLNEIGSYDDSFTLPSAGMGWHTVELDFNDRTDPDAHPNWRLIASHSFQVEDYRVNTFEVSLDSETAYSFSPEIEIPLTARYYMGKPLSKAEMQWNLYAYSQYPRPRGFDEFAFGDRTADRETHTDEGTAALSSQGTATISANLPEQKTNPGPRSVSITAQVTDANQQTISGSSRFTVHSSDFYLGLRVPEGVHRAGDTATFSLAAVSTEGEAWTEEVPVTVLVEKEVWNTVKVMGANGRMTHRNDRRLEMVAEETVALVTRVDPDTELTLANPHLIKFTEAGDYLVTLTSRDAENRPVITRSRFTVIGAEEPSWSWYDVIRIDLIPDKNSYEVGETAKLLVRSPVFGHALVTTERGGVRSTESMRIDDYETIIDIPIENGDAPNLFASVLIIRGSKESPHIHTSADYRLGYCHIGVEDPASRLEVTIDSGKAEYYQPGEEVTVTAMVGDGVGNGVTGAEVVLFAVDEGVLSLTDHQTPDPHDVFHDDFPLSVFTGQSISDLLPENPLEQDFMNKGYVIGGGGANNGLDPDRVRKDFKALAFWEPGLRTDADGVVSATFIAPDNLSEFRIMAIVAEGNRFGHSEAPVVINKPLIIEPALPVFTNITDQVDVSAVLHNNTTQTQQVEVEVGLDEHAAFIGTLGEAVPTALTDTDSLTRKATAILDPGATETVSFPIALTSVGEAKWNWKVRSISNEQLRDQTESTTQVGFPLPKLREAHTFTLREGESLGDALARIEDRLLSGTGEVEVKLSNSRLVEASDALDYLLTYPYGCVEQTTSSLIPWLSTRQLRDVMPQLKEDEAEVKATIKKGVDRLFSMQTGDGGLGYWPGATQSVLWGSAYGAVAIALAQEAEVEVPAEQADALWKYLAKSLRNTAELSKPYDLSQRCLASYALALGGINESSYHEVLFTKRNQLSDEARALLALAMI
ncbi:MAG: alpha-2-macroglobulin family protein [Verrucomicrobiota bacterium]